MLNAALSYNILDWLNVSGRIRVDNSHNTYPEKTYASTNTQLTELSGNGLYGITESKDRQIYGDTLLNINKTFGTDWSLQANIDASFSDMKNNALKIRGPISDGKSGKKAGLANVFNIQNLSGSSRTTRLQIAVTLNTNVPYRELAAAITSDEEGWLTKGITSQGSSDTEAIMYFDMAQNGGMNLREATVKITGSEGDEVILKITQLPLPRLEVEILDHALDVTGTTLEIPVTANVEFEVTLSDDITDEWLTYDGYADSKLKFTYKDLPKGERRSCKATITEKNASEGLQPLSFVLLFTQKAKSVINTAVNMKGTRAWPAWNNPAPVTRLNKFTIETLVYSNNWLKGSVSTIMGIEDKFLIRVGDMDP